MIRVAEGVQVVATNAPQNLWKAAVNLGRVFDPQPSQRPVASALERIRVAGRLQFGPVQRAKMGDRPVPQRHVEIQYVVDGLAVQDRAGATGVVADHAADRGPAGGRDVRGEPETVGQQGGVQFVEHDARLDSSPPFFDIYLEEAVEVLGSIELQPGADRLSGLRRATPAHRD